MKCLIIERFWLDEKNRRIVSNILLYTFSHPPILYFPSFFFLFLELIKFITIIPRVLKLGIPVFVTQLCL